MRVLVTRPPHEAARWVSELQSRGVDAVALPLIELGPSLQPQAVAEAWGRFSGYAAAMFVSGPAVAYFFESNSALAPAEWSKVAIKTRCWATGPGTCQALARAGVEPAAVDAPPASATQFDSEALWQVVAPTVCPGQRVLIVRGSDGQGHSAGRDWLSRTLLAAGVAVDTVAAYTRRAPVLAAAQQALACQSASDGSLWIFSSSEAIANLGAALPAQDWGAARCVVTHPRIAQAARDAGFGTVHTVSPTLDAVVASIESKP